jgi:hypothetical protein
VVLVKPLCVPEPPGFSFAIVGAMLTHAAHRLVRVQGRRFMRRRMAVTIPAALFAVVAASALAQNSESAPAAAAPMKSALRTSGPASSASAPATPLRHQAIYLDELPVWADSTPSLAALVRPLPGAFLPFGQRSLSALLRRSLFARRSTSTGGTSIHRQGHTEARLAGHHSLIHHQLVAVHQPCPTAMPFSANSCFACSFLARCVRPMPRSTLGALVNWMLS